MNSLNAQINKKDLFISKTVEGTFEEVQAGLEGAAAS